MEGKRRVRKVLSDFELADPNNCVGSFRVTCSPKSAQN